MRRLTLTTLLGVLVATGLLCSTGLLALAPAARAAMPTEGSWWWSQPVRAGRRAARLPRRDRRPRLLVLRGRRRLVVAVGRQPRRLRGRHRGQHRVDRHAHRPRRRRCVGHVHRHRQGQESLRGRYRSRRSAGDIYLVKYSPDGDHPVAEELGRTGAPRRPPLRPRRDVDGPSTSRARPAKTPATTTPSSSSTRPPASSSGSTS